MIVQKVREAERDRQYQEYKDRIGDIVNGIVKRVEYGNVVVDLGRGEAIVRRDEMLPRETLRNGDRIRAYIYDVRREPRGPQIFLSRTHPQFMAKLFAQEVPEIYDGIVEVKAVARDPGLARQDRGDLARFLGRSGRRLRRHARLARAGGGERTAGREDRHHSVVAGHRDLRRQRAGAGRSRQGGARRGPRAHRGRGAGRSSFRSRSAGAARTCGSPRSSPAGTSTSSPSRKSPSAARPSSRTAPSIFIEALDVDEVVGQLLASEGFSSVEELAVVDEKEIAGIEGFDEDTARELQTRAREYLAQDRRRARRQAQGARRRGRAQGRARRHHARCWSSSARTTSRRSRIWPAAPPTIWSAGPSARTARPSAMPGILDGFEISREDAEAMIMQARVKAGWITEADLAPPRGRGRAGRSRSRAQA